MRIFSFFIASSYKQDGYFCVKGVKICMLHKGAFEYKSTTFFYSIENLVL